MKFILIAAVSKNGFIGKNNKLIWKIPKDLKRFKKLTIGETVLMGRKTFESIGKILPKRKNIILTKKKFYLLSKKINKKNVIIISSLQEIYSLSCKKIFVIGGEKVYNKMIKKAETIELTIIHKNFYGDAKFPKIKIQEWKKIKESCYYYFNNGKNSFNYQFIKIKRIF